ncbi:putative DsbA family dithiol-disulfide isomerase [Streptosporangium becharense]|uniref:Putative DsbA family dithiol-disulfide isomerase n=1 Tax=Streptosporangium becharense TaxID=1816182 RepID=A0A7W9IKP7_9ACTN|nr:DsbA family oxidoreductase [Streptosporangium becharense]MBB2911725.1 putative DsbA family dithiol-disulfide isomerase [Streptosporangium becharense]MBB5822457.1 putative DsbA family dithiol-disulfide isomerase [Streptosporangium becharense]
MKVEIYSDVVCPWCYIGHTRFARAVERYRAKGGEVEVEFRPFQLAPDAESNGELTRDWAAGKFGGAERAAQMFARVSGAAAEDGLALDFDHAIQANTFDAHRLIQLAVEQGKGEEALYGLFRAHFTDGLDIGSREVLAGLADRIGVKADLDGEDGAAAVREELARGRALGVSAVPLFLFEGQFAVSGAQPEDTLLAALEEVAERTGQSPAARAVKAATEARDVRDGADVCDDEGYCAV